MNQSHMMRHSMKRDSMMRHSMKRDSMKRRQRGAVAFEYVIISVFAGAISLASVAFLGKLVKHELSKLSEEMGSDQDPDDRGGWPFEEDD